MEIFKKILFLFLLFGGQLSIGQLLTQSIKPVDLEQSKPISYMLKKEKNEKDPHKATLLAVFLPGSGQIYNEKYWKVPIVYAGLGIAGYAIFWNSTEMNKFQKELSFRKENTGYWEYGNLTGDQLKSNRNFYRTNRDISILSFVGIYALQIVDAAVDAHLSGFSVDDKLTLDISPRIENKNNIGIGLKLKF